MSLLFHTIESRVTRNSKNEDALVAQCKAAVERGGYFQVTEEYRECWWTVFKIVMPLREDADANSH